MSVLSESIHQTIPKTTGEKAKIISHKNGTSNESISGTYSAGTFYARVYGKNNANNATRCYILKVQTGTASQQEIAGTNQMAGGGDVEGTFIEDAQTEFSVSVFPNPASNRLTVYVIGDDTPRKLMMYDVAGKVIYKQAITEMFTTLDLHNIAAGNYVINVVKNEGEILHPENVIKQ